MQVLVHPGLNKCASTYVQDALDGARPDLKRAGTWYPEQSGPPCQYGLSRAYGFGPDDPSIAQQSVASLVGEAARHGCKRLILSSEYLSLYRPAAAERLMQDLQAAGCAVEFILFSRDPLDWIRSLFNQYVRTVEGAGQLPHIDAFVDQVLGNGAIDIARRYRMWANLVGPDAMTHYRLPGLVPEDTVLAPFAAFAGMPLHGTLDANRNASVDCNALWRIGQLRVGRRTKAEDRELEALLNGAPTDTLAPKHYATISPERLRRLQDTVIGPYHALPVADLGAPKALAA